MGSRNIGCIGTGRRVGVVSCGGCRRGCCLNGRSARAVMGVGVGKSPPPPALLGTGVGVAAGPPGFHGRAVGVDYWNRIERGQIGHQIGENPARVVEAEPGAVRIAADKGQYLAR